jgi:hypothetical protein
VSLRYEHNYDIEDVSKEAIRIKRELHTIAKDEEVSQEKRRPTTWTRTIA